MRYFGMALKALGVLAYIAAGFWGMWLCIVIVNQAAGFWGVVLGFTFLPVTFYVAPFYAAFALGDWTPLIVAYGGTAITAVLYGLGSLLDGEPGMMARWD